MKTITLHYKDDNGVVRDTVRHVVSDGHVSWYLHCYGRDDLVVVRVRPASPGDLHRNQRRTARVTRRLDAA